MKWTTHLIVGATAGLIIAKYTGIDYVLMASAGAFFGVLPDGDIIISTLGLGEHRGAYSHSLGSSVIMGIIAVLGAHYLFYYPFKLSLYLGFVAFSASFLHDLTDALTYSGVKLFWPLSKRRYRGFVRYNSIVANMAIIIICLAALYYAGILGFLHGIYGK